MTEKRRTTDRFNPEPAPTNLKIYRERSWHTLQQVAFHLTEINGRVSGNEEDIIRIDKDVTVAKKLAWVAMAILTLAVSVGGLLAAFGN